MLEYCDGALSDVLCNLVLNNPRATRAVGIRLIDMPQTRQRIMKLKGPTVWRAIGIPLHENTKKEIERSSST